MNSLQALVFLFVGLGFGSVVAWLLLRARSGGALSQAKAELQAPLATLSERISAKDQQLDHLQKALAAEEDQKTQLAMQLQQEATARASADAQANRVPQLEARLAEAQAESLQQKEQSAQLQERIKGLEEKLAAERQQMAALQEQFQKDFERVAHRLLLENASRFSQQSGENLEKLLKPLEKNLAEFKVRLETAQEANSNYAAVLKAEVGRIGAEAANLSKALKGDAKVLGNWGENSLDQILEKSGLQKDIHYRRQISLTNAEGDRRSPDVVVQLPDNRSLVIDSKVSLNNYQAAVNAADEQTRQQFLENLARDLRKHFTDLGAKRYQDLYGINAPEFVLMYIPIEPAYFATLSHRPELFAEALDRNVVLITNSTLLGTLRTVASVWRLADQQRHALEIAKRGGDLYDKFVGVLESFGALGKNLNEAKANYSTAMDRLHEGRGNLLWQIEQLKTLGAKASKAIPAQLLDKAVAENEAVDLEHTVIPGEEPPGVPASGPVEADPLVQAENRPSNC